MFAIISSWKTRLAVALWVVAPIAQQIRTTVRVTLLLAIGAIVIAMDGHERLTFNLSLVLAVLGAGACVVAGLILANVRLRQAQYLSPHHPLHEGHSAVVVLEYAPTKQSWIERTFLALIVSTGVFSSLATFFYVVFGVGQFVAAPEVSRESAAEIWHVGLAVAGLAFLGNLLLVVVLSRGYFICKPGIRQIPVRFKGSYLKRFNPSAPMTLIRRLEGVYFPRDHEHCD